MPPNTLTSSPHRTTDPPRNTPLSRLFSALRSERALKKEPPTDDDVGIVFGVERDVEEELRARFGSVARAAYDSDGNYSEERAAMVWREGGVREYSRRYDLDADEADYERGYGVEQESTDARVAEYKGRGRIYGEGPGDAKETEYALLHDEHPDITSYHGINASVRSDAETEATSTHLYETTANVPSIQIHPPQDLDIIRIENDPSKRPRQAEIGSSLCDYARYGHHGPTHEPPSSPEGDRYYFQHCADHCYEYHTARCRRSPGVMCCVFNTEMTGRRRQEYGMCNEGSIALALEDDKIGMRAEYIASLMDGVLGGEISREEFRWQIDRILDDFVNSESMEMLQ